MTEGGKEMREGEREGDEEGREGRREGDEGGREGEGLRGMNEIQ